MATTNSDEVLTIATLQALTRAAATVKRRAESEILRSHRLSWGGFVILRALAAKGGDVETGTLARMCDLAKGTLTGMVDTLGSQDYVRRLTVADDRRRVIVHLTESGRAVVAEIEESLEQFCAGVGQGIDLTDASVTDRVLTTIISNTR
jgi:DNA-binding MarR family transcriptional regulator